MADPDAAPDFAARVAGIYAAFNRRDVPALLARMTEDVAWPNGWEGGVVHGRAEVRDYWERQWSLIDPEVTPLGVALEPDGVLAVRVHQVVRDRAGTLLSEQDVTHAYTLRGDLIAGMEIRE